ncbi:MAG: TRAP transporter small permease subunit [Desulfobacterales bacterium]|nr:TRAP transporter small permease subunit [Desulfobacterales bacterium]
MDRTLGRLEGWLLILFLAVMVTLTLLQVALRALFIYAHLHWANSFMGQIDWAEPLVRLLVLWVSLLGASLVTGENKHIKIDLMSDLLPPPLLPYRELLISAACALVAALMLKASITYVRLEASFGAQIFTGLPNWVGQLILPIGFSVIFFRFSIRAIDEAVTIYRGFHS